MRFVKGMLKTLSVIVLALLIGYIEGGYIISFRC